LEHPDRKLADDDVAKALFGVHTWMIRGGAQDWWRGKSSENLGKKNKPPPPGGGKKRKFF
jgi:hypothetical protein